MTRKTKEFMDGYHTAQSVVIIHLKNLCAEFPYHEHRDVNLWNLATEIDAMLKMKESSLDDVPNGFGHFVKRDFPNSPSPLDN